MLSGPVHINGDLMRGRYGACGQSARTKEYPEYCVFSQRRSTTGMNEGLNVIVFGNRATHAPDAWPFRYHLVPGYAPRVNFSRTGSSSLHKR